MPLTISGPAYTHLSLGVPLELRVDQVPVRSEAFPDVESYLRFWRDNEEYEVVIVAVLVVRARERS